MIKAEELRGLTKTKEELEERFISGLLGELDKNIRHLADNGLFQLPESFAITTNPKVFEKVTNELIENGFHIDMKVDENFEGKDEQQRFFLMVGWAENGLNINKEETDEE